METKTARHLAYDVLHAVLVKGAYANLALQQILRAEISKEDRKFLTELVYGTIRRLNVLEWNAAQISARPVSSVDDKVRILLCIGLYQILYMNSVPDSAAVNETVKVAKKVTHAGNVKFVNAVLRNFLRKRETLKLPDDGILRDSLALNMPVWLIRRWSLAWGREKALSVLRAFNEIHPVDIRVNTQKANVSELFAELTEVDASPAPIAWCANGLTLADGGVFFRGNFLREGKAYVQNRASMIPALVLDPKAGERVLDMCAAPGSKTTQMADMMQNTGRITAWDLYPHKVKLIRENAKRMGLSVIFAEAKDATVPDIKESGAYDKVLLDAPCSGLGVLGRKSEIRHRRNEKDLETFPALQKKLMRAAATYVKPGGILVYSTCTLEKAENEDMVSSFLNAHTEFETVPFSVGTLEAPGGMLTLWPDIHECDGFFTAKLRRKS